MRKKDREITDRKAMEAIISGAEVCRIALCDGNEPYVVPVSFAYRDNAIYFHSAPVGKKIEILAKNPRCCVEVDSSGGPARSDNPCQWEMGTKASSPPGQPESLKIIEKNVPR
jgi:hypothetical protein